MTDDIVARLRQAKASLMEHDITINEWNGSLYLEAAAEIERLQNRVDTLERSLREINAERDALLVLLSTVYQEANTNRCRILFETKCAIGTVIDASRGEK